MSNDDDLRDFPRNSNRDPNEEFNQLRPRSLRSNGLELDEVCGDQIQDSGFGAGMDAFKKAQLRRKK
jgi:hypothetical protein